MRSFRFVRGVCVESFTRQSYLYVDDIETAFCFDIDSLIEKHITNKEYKNILYFQMMDVLNEYLLCGAEIEILTRVYEMEIDNLYRDELN